MPTYTTHLGLAKPDAAQNNWTSLMNGNLDSIDSALAAASGASEHVVSYSSTPNFDLSQGNVQKILLTGNVSSSSVSNPSAGFYLFVIVQDATGGRTFTFPSSFRGTGSVSASDGTATANSYASQLFAYLPSTVRVRANA